MGRENDLYRDKIEVSLDGRQIFSLFFAGAVIVCAVFVIGVIVGKRVEARAHVDRAAGVAGDPLAALDRLEADAPLSFRRTLRSGQAAGGSVDAEIAAMASAQQVAQGDGKGGHKAGAKPEGEEEAAAPRAAAGGEADAKPEAKADAKSDAKPDAKSEAKADAKAEERDREDKRDAKADAAKAGADDERAESGKSDKGKADGEGKAGKDGDAKAGKDGDAKDGGKEEKKKSRYTLQLSAFQERGEAETFLSELRAAGYSPYVTPAEVDGKAYYRVRLGTYPSYDDAVKAKMEFERKIGRIAYVTKL
jgi:cell division protein FtsN